MSSSSWVLVALALMGGCAKNDYFVPPVGFDDAGDAAEDSGLMLPDAGSDSQVLPDATLPEEDSATPDASTPDASTPDASTDAAMLEEDATVPEDTGPVDVVAQLTAIRALPDGEVEGRVMGATVTYLKPSTPRPEADDELAGFFVQAGPTGPAIFVEIDPASLTPEPVVGDLVRFKVVGMGTLYSQRRVTAIEAFDVLSSGAPLDAQSLDVADLVSGLDDYESETFSGEVKVDDAFAFSGAGYLAVNVHTSSIPDAMRSLRVRVPGALATELEIDGALREGCVLAIEGAPMWRFNGVAQIAAWRSENVSVSSCPELPDPPDPVGAGLVINEIDYDIVGTESTEFVELYNGTADAYPLANVALVLFNGSNGREYGRVTFAADVLVPAGGYLVLASDMVAVPEGVMRLDLPAAENALQNGAPDGLALVDLGTNTLIDALTYEGSMSVTLTGVTEPISLVEGESEATPSDSNTLVGSLCRSPNGNDTNESSVDWAFCSMLTPGASNAL